MDTATHAAQSALADDLVQVVVILDVVFVAQIELLWVQLDAVALIWRVVSPILQHVLEVLPAERDELLWLLSNDFLDEVLKDAREGIRHFNLLCCENTHLTHVGHLVSSDYSRVDLCRETNNAQNLN